MDLIKLYRPKNNQKTRYSSINVLYSESLGRSIATVNAIALFIFILSLIFLPWVQTSKGNGKISAYNPNDREQQIDAPIDGRIARWFVNEGSRVKEGEIIAEMSDFDSQILERINSERDALIKRLDAAQKSTKMSNKNLQRQKKLFEEGITSRKDYEKAEIDYAGYLASEASASAELTKIDTRLSRQWNQYIKATRDGVISRIFTRQGTEIVKAGNGIAVLVPQSVTPSVELYLSAMDLPLVQVGQTVRLQFEGWPSIQFSGWPSVAIGTFLGKIANVDPSVNDYGKFRVLVIEEKNNPWPEQKYLRQGMRARGWVQLSTVSLGYELWRNFNGFPVTIDKPKENKTK